MIFYVYIHEKITYGKMKDISRRNFLKVLGVARAATAGIASCARQEQGSATEGKIPTDKMTYRDNPSTGDHVSILGFGMMRLPSVDGRSAREGDEEIDQEMVNRLVDTAIEHGVNYFDTSPA